LVILLVMKFYYMVVPILKLFKEILIVFFQMPRYISVLTFELIYIKNWFNYLFKLTPKDLKCYKYKVTEVTAFIKHKFSSILPLVFYNFKVGDETHLNEFQCFLKKRQQNQEILLLKIQDFGRSFQKEYKCAWNLLINGNHLLQKGSYALKQIDRYALENPKLSFTFLIKIIEDIRSLLKSHIQVDESLEVVYSNISNLIGEAKYKTEDSIGKVNIFQKTYDMKDRIILFSGNMFLGSMKASYNFTITGISVFAIYYWCKIIQIRFNVKQYVIILKDFLKTYKNLQITRSQVRNDIITLTSVRKFLELLILHVEDMGMILKEEHLTEFSRLINYTRKKFTRLQAHYKKILKFSTSKHRPFSMINK